jgi:hypothetical protein
MEAQDLSQTIVRQERSYLSCLALGWQVAMNNIGMLLRYAWPSMLFTLLLPLPGIFFFAGQVDALLCRWIDLGYVPSATVSSLRSDILYRTGRNLWLLLFGILVCLIAAVMSYAVIRMGLSIWWYIGAMIVLVLLILPAEVIAMELSYTRKPLLQCLRGYAVGCRYFGTLFVFEIVGIIFVGIGFMLGAMPSFAISAVVQQAMQAHSIGDAIDLPIMFPVVAFLAYAISMFVFLLCHFIYSFWHCLLWGSIMAREEGRKQQLAHEDSLI